jgi:hypothetical protein
VEIEVSDPSLVEGLLEFLRSSGWDASRGNGWTVAVRLEWPQLCESCGNEVAEVLRRLAALECHDCRAQAWARAMRIG